MDDLTRYGKRGYYVKENAPVYLTKNIERPAHGSGRCWAGTATSAAGMRTGSRFTAAYLTIRVS